MPDGYRGLVVGRKGVEGEKREVEDRWRCEYGNDAEGGEQEGGEEDEDEEEVAILEELATFEEMVVWDHEKVVEDGDGIVKGLEEWIRFAEVVSPFSPFLSFAFSFLLFHEGIIHRLRKSMIKR